MHSLLCEPRVCGTRLDSYRVTGTPIDIPIYLEDGEIPELGSLTLDLYPDINQYQGYRLLRQQPPGSLTFLKDYCAPCSIALDIQRSPTN